MWTPARQWAILCVLLAGCGGGSDAGTPPTGVDPPTPPAGTPPAATPRGAPTGASSSAMIGMAGGRVTSADGVLTIDIPAGALASTTTITIQPVQNTAPGSFISGYRLGPEGVTFTRPVTLSFAIPSGMADGIDFTSASIASQNADGTWTPAPTDRNQTAGTVTATTTHFSDWVVITNLWIDPPAAAVDVGNTRSFTANVCFSAGGALPVCTTDPALAGVTMSWSLSGPGTVTPSTNGATATYRAPATAPTGTRVFLNVSATRPSGQRATAVAVISVGRQTSFGGTIEVTQSMMSSAGTITVQSRADVSFRWNDGQQAYTPNGNVAITYDVVNSVLGCATHLSGGRSILDGDGELRLVDISGQIFYTGAGFLSRSVLLTGTSDCNDKKQPQAASLDQTGFGWWPFPPPQSGLGYPVRSNGTTLQEDIQSTTFGNTRVKWLLTAGR